jgi:hypothetical protein
MDPSKMDQWNHPVPDCPGETRGCSKVCTIPRLYNTCYLGMLYLILNYFHAPSLHTFTVHS